MEELLQTRRELERDLRHALEARDQLDVHYQPVYSAADGKMTGVEALLRWRHPERGMIAPDVFIPIAEATGLIDRLGQFVLAQACTSAMNWGDLEVAINASALELKSETYAMRVLSQLERLGFDPKRLEIEITETALVDDSAQCERNVNALRSVGVRFALDDFGTGFSSLGRLQRLQVDRIKIDRCFVSRIGQPDGNEAIVQAIISLAHANGLRTTAEGVETDEQSKALCRMGCDEFQGFLLSAPVPGHALPELISVDKRHTRRARAATT
jgi:EAL domain-containing protein (putative c-di-GMP-specific phosphodiesterase class I)